MEPSFSRYVAELAGARPHRADGGLIGPENFAAVESVESTNQLARAVVAEYEREAQVLHPLLIVAFEQSGGRGRQGRSWSSPRGKGVYATRVLGVAGPELLQTLPLLVAIGLCRGLAPHLPVPCRLKWPNDLVVETAAGRRKIGGILIEALVRPGEGAAAIVGFGVNHGHTAEELPETATSIRLLHGDVPLARLTWDLVAALESELAHLGDTDYAVAAYRDLAVHRPGEPIVCRVGDGLIEGTFRGFDERGRLRLERDGEELELTAGEVIE